MKKLFSSWSFISSASLSRRNKELGPVKESLAFEIATRSGISDSWWKTREVLKEFLNW